VSSVSNNWRDVKPVQGPITLFQAFGFKKGTWSFPQLQAQLPSQVATQKQSSTSGGGPGLPGGPGNESANKSLAQKMAAAEGWTGAQWDALNNIIMAESGYDVSATNPSSGAYGIPQALPGSKMASAGSNWKTSAATQIKWMLGYIRGRYGNPVNAWNFHLANGWY